MTLAIIGFAVLVVILVVIALFLIFDKRRPGP